MMWNKLAFYWVSSLLLVLSCAKPDPFPLGRYSFPSGHWIDLTHDFSSETVYWPTSEPFQIDTVFEGVTDKGYFYSAYKCRD